MHTLVMDGCNCSEEGATHIGNTLVELPYLRKLSMSDCGVGPYGCQLLFLGLAENRALTFLDISCNQLTGYHTGPLSNDIVYDVQAVRAIANCLSKNTALQYLDLGYNR